MKNKSLSSFLHSVFKFVTEVTFGWEATEYTQTELEGPTELCVVIRGIPAVSIPAIYIKLVNGNRATSMIPYSNISLCTKWSTS